MAEAVQSAPLLTTKQVAHLKELPLRAGQVLQDVRIGYETYGTLNERSDNAVLICHYFSGHSHAAGYYADEPGELGWWDAVIGPGKAIDTDRWFVVAMDALACVRIDAPHGVTTGPASMNPATGRAYGPDFPALAIADSVLAQRMVLDQLGIKRLAAVAGPSLGAMQALEWAVSRPLEVDRVIAVIGLAEFQAREIGLYHVMQQAIRMDARFMDGRYDAEDPPIEGLGMALKLMMLLAGGRGVFNHAFGRKPGAAGADPYVDDGATWAIERWLESEGRLRAPACDANAWITMLRTNMRWDLGREYGGLVGAAERMRSRVLLVPGSGDELADLPSYHEPLVRALETAGVEHDVLTLPAGRGHLAGLGDIGLASHAIRRCLEQPR